MYFLRMIPPQAQRGFWPSTSPPISTTTWQPHSVLVQCQRSRTFISMTDPPCVALVIREVMRGRGTMLGEGIYRVVKSNARRLFLGRRRQERGACRDGAQ